ncbi:MAG: riboflavin transport system ATP-binding protein [Pseudothermotoga sp.]|jgi:simple sugar transport system ATP-binding protein|nr:MAG: ABC transporter related [Pseudothermotoga lettingae]MDI3494029.1 riboflavin transport system ATP-binding protein [Pseudothermotoga sp.]MDK2884955.1 riboflavin transport system ATP-binding protein [Pseudothermotoga sp.]HBJ80533.1 ABC transporter ATP-binding protein [Pseudothermotoga sp.]HBT25653.1 ABC transporter ATP-binding protein [Pseudothermotoga sp.]
MERLIHLKSKVFVEMRGIFKTFFPSNTIALKGANFVLRAGKIHALLGENGAGKTTLMKILCGLERMDSGEIFINGNPVQIKSPGDALHLKIAMVHQHLALIDDFTALENIILQKVPLKNLVFLDKNSAQKHVERLFSESKLEVNLNSKIKDLTMAERQKVEILRALYLGAQLLIFDEPTTYLSEHEAENFYRLIKWLKQNGKTVVLITHDIKEACDISDEITVLRNGRTVFSSSNKGVSHEKIAEMMVGRTKILLTKKEKKCGKVVLSVRNLSLPEETMVRNISFEISAGEIVGFAGLANSGVLDILEALIGLRKIANGEIIFFGENIEHKSVKERRKCGISYIPQNRTQVGVSADLSILENLLAIKYYEKNFTRFKYFLNYKTVENWARELLKKFDIQTKSVWQPVSTLSGGNIQRLLIARELSAVPKLLIASDPTAGLDVHSTAMVHKFLLNLRNDNVAVILYSSDLEELLKICDRIIVVKDGTLKDEFVVDENISKVKLFGVMA